MMKAMRKMTRSILWIVIAAFVGTIVFAWGMQFTAKKSKQGVIAVINGQDIPFQNFQYAYETKLRDAQKSSEDEVTDEMAKNIRDQVWSEMVDQLLLAQEVKKKGIVVTNRELYEFMKRFPPQEIMQSEVFQTDGKFDYNKYLQALSDPRVPWGQIEGFVRNQLLIAKLQENIISAVRINDQEVYRKYVDNTQRVRVNYTFIPSLEFPASEVEVSQLEIQKYYDENKEKIKMVERAILKFVEFPKIPTKADEEKTKARLLEVREEILKGEDFAEMAKEYSEDPATKGKGGDLGWLRKGTMKNQFEEAIFSLAPGEISEPVRTEYSMHLIKVLEKREVKGAEEAHASHIVMKIGLSEETLNQMKDRIDEFVQNARKIGFDKAATEERLEVKESGMFVKGSFIPNLGFAGEANKFAFENKPGKISNAIEIPLSFFVVQIKERRPAGIPPLKEAEPFIRENLVNQKLYELAYQKGMQIYQEIKKGKDFKKVVEEYKERIEDSGEFTRNTPYYIPGVGPYPEFTGTAFSLKEANQVSPPLKTTQGTFILQFISTSAVDNSFFQSKSDSLKLDLLRKKQVDFYTQWFQNLKDKAKIEDFRDQYYKETF